MARLRGSSGRTSPANLLRALIVVTCVAVIGLRCWHEWIELDRVTEAIEENLRGLARALAQQTEDTFEIADTVLLTVMEMLRVDGRSPEALARLNWILAYNVMSQPRLSSLTVFDEGGKWVAGSSHVPAFDTDVGDSPFFQHHKNATDRTPFLGEPVRNAALGQWVIPVSRRINRSDGAFAGVVVATIDTKYFSNLFAVYSTGAKGRFRLINDAGALLASYPARGDLIGQEFPLRDLDKAEALGPAGFSSYVSSIDGVARMGGYHFGGTYPILVVAAVDRDEAFRDWYDGVLSRAFSVAVLILMIGVLGWWLSRLLKQREAIEAQLAELASVDGLTGVANRRVLDEHLTQEFKRSLRENAPVSLLLIDVDRFKRFNDRYGHQEGDRCLQAVARVLAEAMQRPSDLAARYGGEEFAVLLPGADRQGAGHVAETLRAGVEALGLRHEGNFPGNVVTISIGSVTLMPESGGGDLEIDDFVSLADRALYEAKAQGRNRVVDAPAFSVERQC